MMAGPDRSRRVLFSAACERNKAPILSVLQQWLELPARVLEVGSGSGQHAVFFCQQIAGLTWHSSDRAEALADLTTGLAAVDPAGLAPGSRLAEPLELDVRTIYCRGVGPASIVSSMRSTVSERVLTVSARLRGYDVKASSPTR